MTKYFGRKRNRAGALALLLVASLLCSVTETGATAKTAKAAEVQQEAVSDTSSSTEADKESSEQTTTPADTTQESSEQTTQAPAEETEAPTSEPTASPDVTMEPNQPGRVDNIPPVEGATFLGEEEVITGFEVTETTTTSIKLVWDEMPGMTSYLIYSYDMEKGEYIRLDEVTAPEYTLTDLSAGQEFYFTVCGYNEEKAEQSRFAEPVHTYTRPEQLVTFQFTKNNSTSITLSWEPIASATGYLIYHAEGNGAETLVGTTTELTYKDTGLKSGTTYRYRIRTYYAEEENTGEYSEKLSTTTLPAKPTIKVRGGNKRVRITWSKLTGATGYRIYQYTGATPVLIATVTGKSTVTYVRTGLTNGTKYKFSVTAYRSYKDKDYEGSKSTAVTAKAVSVGKTSTKAKIYKTKKAFLKSVAVKTCSFLKKKLVYAKCVILPGMTNTNVSEFGCTSMVPQGLTFAGGYMMISAYDSKGLDNSVVYVMSKSSKKLLTTIVLPNKTHAGGIAYDGRNLWICQSTTLRSIPFATIKAAASAKKDYLEVPEYDTVNELGQQAAAVTYYKGLLWVASYNETSSGYLGSYRIDSKASKPTLTLCKRIKIANRVQGLTFTSNGYLVLSRSCQTNASKRGFFHQLDVYKPNLSKAGSGIVKLGKVKKKIDMPSMNEEIAVSGKYLYVNFESSYFASAVKRVDRVCAFKVAAVTKTK